MQAGHGVDGALDITRRARNRGADGWWPDDAPMHHPGHANVVRVFEPAGHHLGHVEPLDRVTEDGPLARGFALGIRIQRDVEFPAADQLAIGNRALLVPHDAVPRREPIGRHAPLLRRHLHERLAGGRRGEREVCVVEILRMRLRAGGHALIGRRAGDALNQLDAIHRHAELFGDKLRLRRVETVPHLAFAGERGDRSIGRDRQPTVQLFRRIADERRHRLSEDVRRREGEGHHKRPAGLQHRAA